MKTLTILSNHPVVFADMTFTEQDRPRLSLYSSDKDSNGKLRIYHLRTSVVKMLLEVFKRVESSLSKNMVKEMVDDYEIVYSSRFISIQNCRLIGSKPMPLFKENPVSFPIEREEQLKKFLYRFQEICSEFLKPGCNLDFIKPLKTISGTHQSAYISENMDNPTIYHLYNASNGISFRVKNSTGAYATAIRTGSELNALKALPNKLEDCLKGKVFCGVVDHEPRYNPNIIGFMETYISNGFANKQHRYNPPFFTISQSGQYMTRRINLQVDQEMVKSFNVLIYKIERVLEENYVFNTDDGTYASKSKPLSEAL